MDDIDKLKFERIFYGNYTSKRNNIPINEEYEIIKNDKNFSIMNGRIYYGEQNFNLKIASFIFMIDKDQADYEYFYKNGNFEIGNTLLWSNVGVKQKKYVQLFTYKVITNEKISYQSLFDSLYLKYVELKEMFPSLSISDLIVNYPFPLISLISKEGMPLEDVFSKPNSILFDLNGEIDKKVNEKVSEKIKELESKNVENIKNSSSKNDKSKKIDTNDSFGKKSLKIIGTIFSFIFSMISTLFLFFVEMLGGKDIVDKHQSKSSPTTKKVAKKTPNRIMPPSPSPRPGMNGPYPNPGMNQNPYGQNYPNQNPYGNNPSFPQNQNPFGNNQQNFPNQNQNSFPQQQMNRPNPIPQQPRPQPPQSPQNQQPLQPQPQNEENKKEYNNFMDELKKQKK